MRLVIISASASYITPTLDHEDDDDGDNDDDDGDNNDENDDTDGDNHDDDDDDDAFYMSIPLCVLQLAPHLLGVGEVNVAYW